MHLDDDLEEEIIDLEQELEEEENEETIKAEETEEESKPNHPESEIPYSQSNEYNHNYFPVKEHLETRYFPPGVLGFAKPSTGEAFVNPDVYGEMKGVVKLHERLHLMYPHLNETSVRMMTNDLSKGPYIPTGVNY